MQIVSWANKRIIVSGSSGFVGSHLVNFFSSSGARALGLTRHGSEHKQQKKLDLTDLSSLEAVVKAFRPHAFFHLASDSLVEAGQDNPYKTFKNNIVAALNVLEVARKHQIQRVIVASTVHVYGNASDASEDEPPRPSRPYETSKTSVDLIAQSYADTYALPVLIPRFVNIYGPGDRNLSRIVPKTITSLLSNKPPTIWGGRAERDYLYIDDAVSAYDLLGRISDLKIERNRIFNFATGKATSSRKIMNMIISEMGMTIKPKKINDIRTHELMRQKANWEKAKRILGWKANISLKTGLSKTIAWYKAIHAASSD